MILKICAMRLISDCPKPCSSPEPPVKTRERTSDMKYGRIPSRSIMFIAPFTNLGITLRTIRRVRIQQTQNVMLVFQERQEKKLYCLCCAIISRIGYCMHETMLRLTATSAELPQI